MNFTIEEIETYLESFIDKPNTTIYDVLKDISEESIMNAHENFRQRIYDTEIPREGFVVTIEEYENTDSEDLYYYDDFYWAKDGKMSNDEMGYSFQEDATHIVCLPENK